MLKDTQVKNPITVVVSSQPEENSQFSEEFLSMVHDRAYETLRAHLERTNQDIAVKLLDDLIILSNPRGKKAGWMYDQILSETIGQASHHVLALGGSFLNG